MERALTWKDVYGLMHAIRTMARRLLRSEAQARSLCTSELVISGLRRQKLVDQDWSDVTWQSREQFFAAMYRAMDRALKDHGRHRNARKRKYQQRISLDNIPPAELLHIASRQPHDLANTQDDIHHALISALSDALTQLETNHPDWARIAQHRYYAGLTIEQTAKMMGIAERTVRRHWEKARILLHDEILARLNQQGYEIPARPRTAATVRHDFS